MDTLPPEELPVSPPPADRAGGRQRRRRRSSSPLAMIGRLWRGWWLEIVVASLALLAVLLLVEEIALRQTLLAWLRAAAGGVETRVTRSAQSLVRIVQGTTLSDLIAYLLLVVAVVLLGWRTRRRVLTNPRLTGTQCPRCGGDLHRIHRRWHHRVLNLVIPVRRYRCKDLACAWQGLRVKEPGHR